MRMNIRHGVYTCQGMYEEKNFVLQTKVICSHFGAQCDVYNVFGCEAPALRGCLPGLLAKSGFVRPGSFRFCGTRGAPRTRALRALKQRVPPRAPQIESSPGYLDQQQNPGRHALRHTNDRDDCHKRSWG